jgi:sodium/proline symporter
VATGNNQIIFSIVESSPGRDSARFRTSDDLFALLKRTTYGRRDCRYGMRGAMVFIWNFWISKLGGAWGIYELLPAFVFSCIVIVVVSLLTEKPAREIQDEFDSVNA